MQIPTVFLRPETADKLLAAALRQMVDDLAAGLVRGVGEA
jgi:hypothetical protein